ncbi:Glu-tRNA(Gln) amidotransferase subunit GatD [archaeon]|nr:Glu-tRNA(Gln) amidotransferase subunit GatD [archaeon]
MTYSKKLQSLIDAAHAKEGGEVRVAVDSRIFEGVLLPRPELGSPDFLILKLNNGYNVGLAYHSSMRIERGGKEPLEVKHEVAAELGKAKEFMAGKLVFDESKPHVSVISTGGTIASRVDYATGGVKWLADPEEFLLNIPELRESVCVSSIHSPLKKASEDMGAEDWQRIANMAHKELNKPDNAGVIVTQGTDTLHFTAAALSFFLHNLNKPVVLVGAQRSSDRGSTDTAINLICSAWVAGHAPLAEVGICMHASMSDDYCLFNRGTKVRKMHTSRRDAFRPINELPLAKVWPDGKIEVTNKNHRPRSDGKVELDDKFEEKVALIKSYPGSDPRIIDFLAEKGYRGIVVEATGLGHVPLEAKKSWLSHLKKAINDGITICFAAQTLYGRLNHNVYSPARLMHDLGVIYCEDMLPETAYIKLGWTLGHTRNDEEVRRMMLHNYAGEISARTLPETFLY